MSLSNKGNFFTASFLYAGTNIGSVFVGAPVITGISGFIPGIYMTFLITLLALSLSLLTAEATLANPDGANVVTITRNLINKTWMVIFLIIFLFINLLPMIGYYMLCIPNLRPFITLPPPVLALLIALIFGCVLFLGVYVSDWVNFVLMLGFLGALLFVIFKESESVSTSSLLHQNWLNALFSLPLLFTVCSVGIIPSMCTYLNRDIKKIKKMIYIGISIFFISYILWQFLVIGTDSRPEFWYKFETSGELFHPLSWTPQAYGVTPAYHIIVCIAVITSLIGLYIALIDVVSDGLGIAPEKRNGVRRALIVTLLFLPPLIVYYLYPQVFTAFFVVKFLAPLSLILTTGVMPVWWVIKSRYFYKLPTPHFLPGGKKIIGLLIIALIVISYLEGVELISH